MLKLLSNSFTLVGFTGLYYCLLYFFLLEIDANFAYYGTSSYDLMRFFLGFFLSLFGIFTLNAKEEAKIKISTLFFVFQLLLIYIPANVFIALHPKYSFLITLLILVVLFTISIFTYASSVFFKAALKRNLSKHIKSILGLPFLTWFLFCCFILIALLLKKGISFSSAFDSSELYNFRKEVFNEYSTVQFIAFYSLAYFVFPLILLYAVTTKKWLILITVLIANLLLYSVTAMKTYFVIPFFTLFFYWLIQKGNVRSFYKLSLLSVIAVCAVMYLLGLYIDSDYPIALFLRSVMEPSELHVMWIDFFYPKTKVPIWVLNPASHPDFPGLKWEEIIAKNLGSSIGNGEGANTGFIADSFSVYGFSGLLVQATILSMILGFLNFVYTETKNGWVAAAAIPSMFLLTNISLNGVIIYFGLGFTVISSICLVNTISKKHTHDTLSDLIQ